jgi:hypothetical protein
MADLVKEPEQQGTVAPVGEEIHMPPPSILPLINAVGLAGAIVTITFHVVLCILFLIVFLTTTVIWIRDTRRDIAQLPLDHSHH